MKKYLQQKLNNEKGMTLIELLAVIVIIAIIAAIAVPAIGNIIDNSRHGAAKSDVLNALAAASLYNSEENGDPATVSVLIPLYMQESGTLDGGSTFDRDNNNLLTIAGTVKISDKEYTFEAINKQDLSAKSSKEFKALLTAK